MRSLFTALLFFFSVSAFAISNDSSCSAMFLDTLNYPFGCGVTNGTNYTFSFDNSTASIEPVQPHMVSCGSSGGMNVPTADSWYYFIASATSMQIQMSPTTNIIASPQIGLYEFRQNCNTIIPRGCATGSNGIINTTFHNLIPGNVYMLQIGGNGATDKGDGVVTLTSYYECGNCTWYTHLEVDPPPAMGAYPPGKKVEFCFAVNAYNKNNGNKLHGIVPDFGPGWDLSTFQTLSTTLTNDGTGQWVHYNNVSTPIGQKDGYFYDQYPLDGNPSNNLGDNGDTSSIWYFCWTIETKAQSSCVNKEDLSVDIHTFSDDETGANSSGTGCPGDTSYSFKPYSNCCAPIDLSVNNETCLDSCDGRAIATVSGTGPWAFWWKDKGGNVVRTQSYPAASTASDTLNNLCDDIYTVHIRDAGANCTGYAAFEVNPPKKHWVYLSDTACIGTCNGEASVAPILGTPPYTYQWDDPASQTTQTATGLCPGFYNVITTDAKGCASKQEIYVFEVPPGNATFNYAQYNYCKNEGTISPANIAMPGGSFSVTPAGLDINNQNGSVNLSNSDTGLFDVRYITATPCPDTAYYQLTIHNAPAQPDVSSTELRYCNSDSSLYFTASANAYHFLKWYSDTSATPIQINKDTLFIPGNMDDGEYGYSVTQQDSDMICESDPVSLTVIVGTGEGVDAGEDIQTCPGNTVMLNAEGGTSYNWSPGQLVTDSTIANPEISVEENTTVFVKVTDSSGCTSTDSVNVIVKDMGDCGLKIYSGFTPNDDGTNDTWVIDGISLYPENKVSIFNRWGDLIWNASGYDNDDVVWKGGNLFNQPVPDGTYYYVVTAGEQKLAGWVEITR